MKFNSAAKILSEMNIVTFSEKMKDPNLNAEAKKILADSSKVGRFTYIRKKDKKPCLVTYESAKNFFKSKGIEVPENLIVSCTSEARLKIEEKIREVEEKNKYKASSRAGIYGRYDQSTLQTPDQEQILIMFPDLLVVA